MFGFGKSAAFITPHDVELCKAKLGSALAPSWAIISKKGFQGHANNWRVSIRKNIGYRNSWQTIFVGAFKHTAAGTQIIGRFRLNLFVIVFTVFWFGAICLACIAFIVAAITGKAAAWTAILPPGMLLFGLALDKFGRYLARDEEAEISVFIEQVLNARRES